MLQLKKINYSRGNNVTITNCYNSYSVRVDSHHAGVYGVSGSHVPVEIAGSLPIFRAFSTSDIFLEWRNLTVIRPTHWHTSCQVHLRSRRHRMELLLTQIAWAGSSRKKNIYIRDSFSCRSMHSCAVTENGQKRLLACYYQTLDETYSIWYQADYCYITVHCCIYCMCVNGV